MQQRRNQTQSVRTGACVAGGVRYFLVNLQVAAVKLIVIGDHQLGELDVLMLDRLHGSIGRGDRRIEAAGQFFSSASSWSW